LSIVFFIFYYFVNVIISSCYAVLLQRSTTRKVIEICDCDRPNSGGTANMLKACGFHRYRIWAALFVRHAKQAASNNNADETRE